MAQIVDLTPRAFLASLTPPLAVNHEGARGRFSKDATEALAKARAEGFLFIGDEGHPQTVAPKAKAPKVTVTTAQAAAPKAVHPAGEQASFNAKDVRVWAKANGHTVGERGRIRPEVIAAFAQAGGKPQGPKVERITPAVMPKVRPQTVGYAVERNTLIAYGTCASKGGCGKPVSVCACKTGPIAPHYLDKGVAGTPLALVKPVV